MLNISVIQGRLAGDPLVNKSGINSQVLFTLACQSDYNKEKTDWIRCVAWGKTAEFIARYFHKGDMMHAVGRLSSFKKEGENYNSLELTINQAYFGSPKKEKEEPEQDFNQSGDLPF